jgi:2,5-diketo-D-gluconate reductase A
MTPRISFHDGHSIPQLGFGLWQVEESVAVRTLHEAIHAGYRSIDGAQIYQNETPLGEAIRTCGVARSELYITTKIWNEEQGRDKTLRSFDVSMKKLGLEKLDLLLIHWPSPHRNLFVETWKTLVEIKKSGRVDSIGVSNFREDDLKKIIDATGVIPVVNQIEVHPMFQQNILRQCHQELGIKTESWSPLGQGKVIADPLLKKIADKHRKSPAQVILRWHLDSGLIAIPKSVTPKRIRENFDVFEFKLDQEDMNLIKKLDVVNGRIGPDPSKAAF